MIVCECVLNVSYFALRTSNALVMLSCLPVGTIQEGKGLRRRPSGDTRDYFHAEAISASHSM